jgi:hypothetical protein
MSIFLKIKIKSKYKNLASLNYFLLEFIEEWLPIEKWNISQRKTKFTGKE